MSPNRPTDQQLADALRRELPAHAAQGLRDRILAEAATTKQDRAGSRVQLLPRVDPGWRAILVAAALLLSLAIGAALVGSILDDLRDLLGRPRGLIAVSANPWEFTGGQNGDIYVLGDGAAPRRLIGSDGDGIAQACPRFAPDGLRLAYGEGRATGEPTDHRGDWPVDERAIVIVRLAADGSRTEPVVRVALPTGSGTMACPEWSPTGREVAFRDGEQLGVADAVSGAVRTFPVTQVAGRFSNEFEWSRDGSKIAVAETGGIHVVALETGESTVLPVDGDAPLAMGWTDGDAGLVYEQVRPVDESVAGVYVVGVDGTTRTLAIHPIPESGASYPTVAMAVSPDGTSVAVLQVPFHCTDQGCNPSSLGVPIVITDLTGSHSEEVRLPDAESLPAWNDGTDFWASGLSWSPDGKRLLLSSAAGIVSIGREAGTPPIIHATGLLGTPLNLEWSWSELTWQPVRD